MLKRLAYSTLWRIALPLVYLRLWLKGRKLPGYRQRWAERLAFSLPAIGKPCIWLHAVSVGECIAATPLIRQLLKNFPDHTVLVTTTTPTGSERIQKTFANQIKHVYLPYDTPGAVKRFLKHFQPKIALIMETELWLNLFYYCKQRSIPVVILNGRLSPKSVAGYRKFRGFAHSITAQVSHILTQSAVDTERYQSICANKEAVRTIGNLKYDQTVDPGWQAKGQMLRQQIGHARPVWIAASTHPGEEEIVIAAARQVKKRYSNALVILVPRHPDRFNTVEKLCLESGLKTIRRTQTDSQTDLSTTDIYLADTMGEMFLLYAAADIAFVAGSFANIGGHNVLEPIALQKPVATGPVMFNFHDIYRRLLDKQGITEVTEPSDLAHTILQLFNDSEATQQQIKQANAVLEENKGALLKTLEIIRGHLSQSI